MGYVSGLWKDDSTLQGLPFATLDKAGYEGAATWATQHVPGVDKKFFYDMLSFDAFELLSTGLGAVGIVFALKSEDKKREFDRNAMFKGGSLALVSMAIFSLLGLPVLIELVIVIAAAALLKKKVLDRDDVLEMSGRGRVKLVFRFGSLPQGFLWGWAAHLRRREAISLPSTKKSA